MYLLCSDYFHINFFKNKNYGNLIYLIALVMLYCIVFIMPVFNTCIKLSFYNTETICI